MSTPISQIHSIPLFPLDNHKFGLYVCESISILQIAYYALPFDSEVELKEMSLAQSPDSTILSCSFKFHFFLFRFTAAFTGGGGLECVLTLLTQNQNPLLPFFFGHATGHIDLSSPDQGWNPRPWQ